MEIPNITDFIFFSSGILVIKIPLLVLIFVYIIFTFIVVQRINAFNRTITIVAANASKTLQLFAIFQFLLSVSLFLFTLVIV